MRLPCCQFTSASRGVYDGQLSGHLHGASGAKSRSHFRTVSPFEYVRLSKYLQPSLIGIGSGYAIEPPFRRAGVPLIATRASLTFAR